MNNQPEPCRRRAIYAQRALQQIKTISLPTVDAADILPKSHTLFLSKEDIHEINNNYQVKTLTNPIIKRGRPKKSKQL